MGRAAPSLPDLAPDQIGVIHGNKKHVTGFIDVALLQSLVRRGVVSDLLANYGHVVVDDAITCPHSFEALPAKPRPATFWVSPRQ